ncbi:hypothetical protein A3H86_00165 [Candidatus Roizmanbacteria bacterium RIFCSPLOWO2_02_FULL_41_9]|uniref:Uncharacterized protein n=1 Tax=Candidatus Roizmanbacteria bacterium RIFCSPLOWO2_02_FULL_41_9 TaxID=1802077 RepID=A0A1F7JRY7_9BACT|nr:MAG: hypothetical protein A3H86_00165 [Candidatus Roizmanbacteria bacterium RIFCSPLOWO2_02_FULL_41_9]
MGKDSYIITLDSYEASNSQTSIILVLIALMLRLVFVLSKAEGQARQRLNQIKILTRAPTI